MAAEASPVREMTPGFLKLMVPLDGWVPFLESSGALVWTSPDRRRAVAATPFWEDYDGILVEADDDKGRLIANGVIPFALTGDDAADAAAYRAVVLPFLRLRPAF
jgi:hypothetical protein